MEDQPPARSAPRIGRPQWLTLASAGFLLSVTLALINAFYAVRGSEVTVRPPEQVLLYRDGEGDRSIVVLVTRLEMINSASSDHGDALIDAAVSFAGVDATFPIGNEVEPTFLSADTATCERPGRCVDLPGLQVAELGDDLVALPGGGVRSLYVAFPLVEWNCTGRDCARFGNAAQTGAALPAARLPVTIKLTLFADGERRLTCGTGPLDRDYLAENGWITLGCEDAEVRGGRWP